MRLVVDENIPGVEALFGAHASKISRLNGRQMVREDLREADVLVVRSVTKVDRNLLEGTPIQFVGTCTIGIDHLDVEYLDQAGIKWCSAPGCNADGVADYVMSAIARLDYPVENKRGSVIGYGNVGKRVARRLKSIGLNLSIVDPYVQSTEFESTTLDSALSTADVVCLHTPLITGGQNPTLGLLNTQNVDALKSGTLVISAGRGPVVSREAIARRPDVIWVLDVWDTEPNIEAIDIANVKIATPHIAGYADEGKLRGTWMVFNEWARLSGNPQVDWSELVGEKLEAPIASKNWRDQILSVYDIARDDAAFRASMTNNTSKNAKIFDRLRKEYPGRHELNRYHWSKE